MGSYQQKRLTKENAQKLLAEMEAHHTVIWLPQNTIQQIIDQQELLERARNFISGFEEEEDETFPLAADIDEMLAGRDD